MITGQCLCGEVRYQIEGDSSQIWLCHCSKCRRASGSAFRAGAFCSAEAFTLLAGEASIREYEDTPSYIARFCARCGSPVPQRLRGTDLVFLHAGCLDGGPPRRVDHHIFAGSKAPWFDIADSLPQFEAHKPRRE